MVRRIALALALFLVPGALSGCHQRAVGAVGDAALPGPDGTPGSDGGLPALYGTIVYEDEHRAPGTGGASARFTAAFYEVDYVLPVAGPEGFVETRVTHDNVECDIYFTAPDWGGGPPPLPPEPDQVDAGEVRLESAFDAGGAFAVSFAGSRYTVDTRPSAEAPLPGWVVPEAMEALAVFLGSPRLAPRNQRLSLVPPPQLLEPTGDGVVQPDADGLFRIAWDADPAFPVQVRLDMNMDWDNATFLCRPPAAHNQVLLPQTWLNEFSWGTAELRLIARQDARPPPDDLQLLYRIRRSATRSVQFEIVW